MRAAGAQGQLRALGVHLAPRKNLKGSGSVHMGIWTVLELGLSHDTAWQGGKTSLVAKKEQGGPGETAGVCNTAGGQHSGKIRRGSAGGDAVVQLLSWSSTLGGLFTLRYRLG